MKMDVVRNENERAFVTFQRERERFTGMNPSQLRFFKIFAAARTV